MKKLLALLLVLLMCFMLVACGNSVNAYVRKNGEDLADDFEDSYSQSGLECDVKVSANKNEVIYDIELEDLNNLTSSQKNDLQMAFLDSVEPLLPEMLEDIQDECPKVENLIFHIREDNGDIICVLKAKERY